MMFLLREREINPCEKFQDPAGIQTQDLLNTSQMLLPLSHLAEEWKTSYISQEASAEFQLTLTLEMEIHRQVSEFYRLPILPKTDTARW